MKIKDYINYQDSTYLEIINIANGIDPKILGILTYEDLFNDKYRDQKYEHWYEQLLHPLITEFRNNCSIYLNDVLCNTINEAYLVLPNTGYLFSTGEETTTFNSRIPNDYIPCVELEGIVEGIRNLEHRYKLRSYWNRSYTLTGNNETVSILPYGSVLRFIDENRKSFKRSFGETNLGKLERSVQLRGSKFDYNIHIPQLTPSEDRQVTGKYEEAVRRHLILQKLMDDNCTGSKYRSIIDAEGNVTLEEID
jgi:hypothetical protein